MTSNSQRCSHLPRHSPKCHTPTISPGVNTALNELQRTSTSQVTSTCASPCPGQSCGRAALARAAPGGQSRHKATAKLHVTFQQHGITRFITLSEDRSEHQVALPTAGSRCPVQLIISDMLGVGGTYCPGLFSSLTVPKRRSGTGTTFLSVCICTFS